MSQTGSSPTRSRRRPLAVVALLVALVLVGVLVALAVGRDGGSTAPTPSPTGFKDGRLLMSDSFSRTESEGWGEAEAGGAYTMVGAGDLSVRDGVGVMELPEAAVVHQASLETAKPQDLQLDVDVTAPEQARRGSGTFVAVHVRSDGQFYYRAALRFGSDGKVSLTVSRFDGSAERRLDLLTEQVVARDVKAGTTVHLRFRVSGVSPVELVPTVTVGEATPVSHTTTDATASRLVAGGGVALWAYTAGSSNGGTRVTFDDLEVLQLVPATSGGTVGGGPASEGGADVGSAVAGSEPLGSTSYPVPPDALVVSPDGSDDAAGTEGAPLADIQTAVDRAPDGGTVVLRAGSYHQSVVLPRGRRLTLQSWPGEEVWLDGSSRLRGWKAVDAGWWTPYDHRFDASPSYTRGAPDGDRDGWRFLDPAYPMAAHPDQVWVDGEAQQQVASAAQVTDGTFFVDTRRGRLLLGTDPKGKQVRASTLQLALTIVGEGDVVRGFGVRRYAPSIPQLGAATVNTTGITVENMVFVDNATTGLSVIAADATLSRLTAERNGLLGMHANYADNLRADRLLVRHNNLEHFNRAPVAGGFKLTSSRVVQIVDSAFTDNLGHGLWFDASCLDMTVARSRMERNTGAGSVVEISSQATLVDDVFLDNGLHGLWVIDTDRVELANSSFGGNAAENLMVVTDGRTPAEPGEDAADPRFPQDPEMTWVSSDLQVYNNVFADAKGDCVVCVVDRTGRQSPESLRLQLDHNFYQRRSAEVGFARWPGTDGAAVRYADLAAFRAGTGQEASGASVDGGSRVVDEQGSPVESVDRVAGAVARGLDAATAAAAGVPEGRRWLGAFDRG